MCYWKRVKRIVIWGLGATDGSFKQNGWNKPHSKGTIYTWFGVGDLGEWAMLALAMREIKSQSCSKIQRVIRHLGTAGVLPVTVPEVSHWYGHNSFTASGVTIIQSHTHLIKCSLLLLPWIV